MPTTNLRERARTVVYAGVARAQAAATHRLGPALGLLFGVATEVGLTVGGTVVAWWFDPGVGNGLLFGQPLQKLTLVSLMGALGSIVSIMIRATDFVDGPHRGTMMPFWGAFITGLLKPVIGAAFALFIYATVLSGLLPLTIPKEELAFFAALSFAAGFSERFAKDVLTKVEGGA